MKRARAVLITASVFFSALAIAGPADAPREDPALIAAATALPMSAVSRRLQARAAVYALRARVLHLAGASAPAARVQPRLATLGPAEHR